MNAPDLAEKLARAVFAAGSDPAPCERLQFLAGVWGVREFPQGGLCEDALAALLRLELKLIAENSPAAFCETVQECCP